MKREPPKPLYFKNQARPPYFSFVPFGLQSEPKKLTPIPLATSRWRLLHSAGPSFRCVSGYSLMDDTVFLHIGGEPCTIVLTVEFSYLTQVTIFGRTKNMKKITLFFQKMHSSSVGREGYNPLKSRQWITRERPPTIANKQ